MLRSSRALLFDLDDTIYPLRRFRLSGLAAVARFHGVDARAAFRVLTTATRRGQAGHELEALVHGFDLKVPTTELVRVIRGHQPSLRLPVSSTASEFASLIHIAARTREALGNGIRDQLRMTSYEASVFLEQARVRLEPLGSSAMRGVA